MSKKILITGGCGFVGSSLAILLKETYPNAEIVAFDNLKRRGSELNIPRLKDLGIDFIHGDIRNKEDFKEIGEISHLIEAAAEPSVLSGINSSPEYLLNTNLNGTINCLDFAAKNKAKFIFLSTSRVYPVRNLNNIAYEEEETRFQISIEQELKGITKAGISEKFPMDGARSFYGASKLSSELLIQEYVEYYDLEAVINRCGVLTGAWQMGKVDQGVIVLWLARHYWKKELNYIGFGGKGKQVRDILHINDLFQLIKLQIDDIKPFIGQIYNVGGGLDVSVSLQELTGICQEITGNKIPIHSVTENRSADIPIYISDNNKIRTQTNWQPLIKPNQILQDIFQWININESIVKNILN